MIEAVAARDVILPNTAEGSSNPPDVKLQRIKNFFSDLSDPNTRSIKRREITTSFVRELIDIPLRSGENEVLHQELNTLAIEEWDFAFNNLDLDINGNNTFIEIRSTNNGERTYLWNGTVTFSDENANLSLTKIGSVENGQLNNLNIKIGNNDGEVSKINLKASFENRHETIHWDNLMC